VILRISLAKKRWLVAATTVKSGGTCGSRWTPNFFYVQNKLNKVFGRLLSQLKKPPKRNSQREKAQTRNGDFKRGTRITVALIPLRKNNRM
jgi:hypothetical protein